MYVGRNLCGVIRNPRQGAWLTVNCRARGNYIKIVGAPRQYLHFCGIRAWGHGGGRRVRRPAHRGRPSVIGLNRGSAKMSSYWKDKRVKAFNPFKTNRFAPRWGQGAFTCIHTLNDARGAWWMARFNGNAMVSRVQLLNRADCCGKRINNAKVYIGNQLCGVIRNPR